MDFVERLFVVETLLIDWRKNGVEEIDGAGEEDPVDNGVMFVDEVCCRKGEIGNCWIIGISKCRAQPDEKLAEMEESLSSTVSMKSKTRINRIKTYEDQVSNKPRVAGAAVFGNLHARIEETQKRVPDIIEGELWGNRN